MDQIIACLQRVTAKIAYDRIFGVFQPESMHTLQRSGRSIDHLDIDQAQVLNAMGNDMRRRAADMWKGAVVLVHTG